MELTELLELKQAVDKAKAAYYQGNIDIDTAYSVCDIYIEAISDVKKQKPNLKIRIPSRSKLMR